VRIDHHFSQSVSAFVRYNHADSTVTQQAVGGPANNFVVTSQTSQTLTAGTTYTISPKLADEARFNWTSTVASSFLTLDSLGGAVPFDTALVLPAPFSVHNAQFNITPDQSGLNIIMTIGRNVENTQHQINFIDNLSWQFGSHLFRFGVDYRRLTPVFAPVIYGQSAFFAHISTAIATSVPDFATISSAVPVGVTFNNYSVYAQDTWKPSRRLSITYGMRWDYNPAPAFVGQGGVSPVIVQGLGNLSSVSVAPSSSTLYHATVDNFAPRFGFAYQLRDSGKAQSVIRGGFGLFYDLGNSEQGNIVAGSPFSAQVVVSPTATFPFAASNATPPGISTAPPYNAPVYAFPLTLRQPYTNQWNLTFEEAVGTDQSFTLAYVGSAGHSLIRKDVYNGGIPAAFTEIDSLNNSGYSNYNSLQAQFRRRAARGLTLLASYTWSHALDNVSSDAFSQTPGQFVNPKLDYGPADFDIRHVGSAAVDYELPRLANSRAANAIVHGWAVDSVITLRSAPPSNVVLYREDFSIQPVLLRPDLVPGVPLYLNDPNAPGGRAYNPAALSVPAQAVQGTLGRHVFRGFPLYQADLALRRNFQLTEKFTLQFRTEAFNIFNHPNFAPQGHFMGVVDPSGVFFPQNGFGVSQAMLNNGLSGGIGSGFASLYQIGGPRSLQLALKLLF
jgi:hypothetical protein